MADLRSAQGPIHSTSAILAYACTRESLGPLLLCSFSMLCSVCGFLVPYECDRIFVVVRFGPHSPVTVLETVVPQMSKRSPSALGGTLLCLTVVRDIA